ncbi:MAG: hypothetical protein N2688_13095, partial [Burkholderiaceae bacterium]|nr:hypothetical protein [Burkholderiaceae bacterium]
MPALAGAAAWTPATGAQTDALRHASLESAAEVGPARRSARRTASNSPAPTRASIGKMQSASKKQGVPADAGRPTPQRASQVTVTEAAAGQRLDNFLLRLARGVPKSHV